jgi:hypothetical protein
MSSTGLEIWQVAFDAHQPVRQPPDCFHLEYAVSAVLTVSEVFELVFFGRHVDEFCIRLRLTGTQVLLKTFFGNPGWLRVVRIAAAPRTAILSISTERIVNPIEDHAVFFSFISGCGSRT